MSDKPLQNRRRTASSYGEARHQFGTPSHSSSETEQDNAGSNANEQRGRSKYSFTPTASALFSDKWDVNYQFPKASQDRPKASQDKPDDLQRTRAIRKVQDVGVPQRREKSQQRVASSGSTRYRRERKEASAPARQSSPAQPTAATATSSATRASAAPQEQRHTTRKSSRRTAQSRSAERHQTTARLAEEDKLHGIPLWLVPLLTIAALLTGAVLSMDAGSLGWMYLTAFGLISLIIALFVEPRGIFLAVTQIPLVFSVVTPIAGWMVAQTHTTNNFSTTVLLGSAYPLFQQFPFLLLITVGAAAIGYLRWLQLRRAERGELTERTKAVQSQRSSDEKNRRVAQRARRISTSTSRPRNKDRDSSSSLTVQDLLRRQESGTRGRHGRTSGSEPSTETTGSHGTRSVDDDLYQ
ncbi:DUF6542 domain-containing protein [Corynebacterium pyruviciproducens]|uniref:DUF6542 domain-containing protein n=1 Tax=Corynebacterium pyruviciproducens TaxID=598660 RepID=A0AAF1BQZ2_9CORY|nr:DUF6542 domain-containing protein [Corynebacterium pyruviciproducens]WOT01248.1 DUF6542 domain-containing protein [Corynebacterium pyruviciproducens]